MQKGDKLLLWRSGHGWKFSIPLFYLSTDVMWQNIFKVKNREMKGREIDCFMFAEGLVGVLRQLISSFVWPYKGVSLLTTKCLSAAYRAYCVYGFYLRAKLLRLTTEHRGCDPIQTVTLVRCFLQLLILARPALLLSEETHRTLIRLRVRQQGLVILFIIVTKLYQK